MFSPSAYAELTRYIVSANEAKRVHTERLSQLKQQVLDAEEKLGLQKQEQDSVNKKNASLSRLVLKLNETFDTQKITLATFSRKDFKPIILRLEAEIERLQAENQRLSQTFVVKELPLIKLKRINLQEEQEKTQDLVATLKHELELVNAECLATEFLIQQTKTAIKQHEKEVLEHANQLPIIQENVSMLKVLELNMAELRYLLMIAPNNKDLEAFLHWHLGWLGFFTQDFFLAGNHLYVAMFYKPEIYQSKKMVEIENILREKKLWFNDGMENYDYYLKRKYSSEPISLEELIFWANRVIITKPSFDVEYEMFSDLLDYSARQNDWNMIDGIYTALSILSSTRPLFVLHLQGIVQPIYDYVEDLFTQPNRDYLYLFCLPKMKASKFYNEHIKPKNVEFWTAEEAKIDGYCPMSELSKLETVVQSLMKMLIVPAAAEYNPAWVYEMAKRTDLPFLLRAWITFAWAQRLMQQGKYLDSHLVLDYALSIYGDFKEAQALKQKMGTGFSIVFFPQPKPVTAEPTHIVLPMKREA